MKPVLIFSGANDRAVIAFCRYAKSVSIPFVIVANGEDDLVFLSDYKNEVIATRSKNILNWDIFIQNVTIAKNKFSCEELFVLPTTEYINRFLLENKVKIQEQNVTFGLCDEPLYARISDKYDFGNLCEKYNILTPKEYSIKPDFFPYVIKPKAYFNDAHDVNLKPALIYNQEQEHYFLNQFDSNNFYFQEYVGGKSIYLLFHFAKNNSYTVYSQENFMQQHDGGSMILAKSSNYHLENDLVQPYVNLFQKENFHGLVMIEVKFYEGKYYMIEANPRFWGPSQLILDAKMTLFDDFCLDNELIQEQTTKSEDYINQSIYFWSGGLIQTQKNKSNLMFYNYDKELFLKEYSSCISNEMYFRKDTIQTYIKENS